MSSLKKVMAALVVLGLTLGLSVEVRADRAQKMVEKDDLPYEGGKRDGLSWDVKALEKNPDAFTLVKRTASKRSVEWVVQVNSQEEVDRANLWAINPHYAATFLDDDGTVLTTVVLWYSSTDLRVGERVRVGFKMPGDDVIKQTRQVVIKLR